jgi:quercetin dioxygenase-like cupin family protein
MVKEVSVGFQVFDYRRDIRNVLVTPQIRARFQRMEVGQVNRGHSHDLGQEVFLILQGQAEFEMAGEARVLGPGEMCIALTDEVHTVRNVGAEPVIMYLSVTPHIQPTHTLWDDQAQRQPPHYSPAATYDVPPDETTPNEALIAQHLTAVQALAETAAATTQAHQQEAAALRQALAADDSSAAAAARDEMGAAVTALFQRAYALAEAWNALAARLSGHAR